MDMLLPASTCSVMPAGTPLASAGAAANMFTTF